MSTQSGLSQQQTVKLPGKYALGWELSGVIALKLCLIYIIYLLCFSHPAADHVNNASYVQHLLSADTPAASLANKSRVGQSPSKHSSTSLTS